MSSPKPARAPHVSVHISKDTGGAYADIREVIESEIARIKAEWEQKPTNGNTDTSLDDVKRGSDPLVRQGA